MKDDGGSAFPGEQGYDAYGGHNQTWSPGMSLRDWFAGMALNGLLADPHDPHPRLDQTVFEHYSEAAFRYADTMLREREKK